ncbi:MAG: N-acetyltransferase family protein [Hyphomicrobiales bacterium]
MSEFAAYAPRPDGAPPRTPLAWVVRPAEESDLEAIAAMAAAREGEPTDAWRERMRRLFDESRAGDRGALFVAERDGAVAGYGKVAFHRRPADSGASDAPEGWYLTGVVVRPDRRRLGAGAALTRARLAWITARSPAAYYVVNERNRASIDLHRAFGFEEVARDVRIPGVRFEGGEGVLFRRDLTGRG